RTIIYTSSQYDTEKANVIKQKGIEIYPTTSSTTVNLHDVLQHLGEQSISSVLVEGGGTVNASFIEQQLMDKLVLYFAPKIVGGKNAPTFVEGQGVEWMRQAVDLEQVTIEQLGKDFKLIGYPVYSNEG